MSFPAGVVAVSVHGRIADPHTDEPATGWVQFEMKRPLRNSSGSTLLAPFKNVRTLDANGEFDILLPATDAPDLAPQNWLYEIFVGTDKMKKAFRGIVPADTPGSLSFADMLDPESVDDMQLYALLGHTHVAWPVYQLTPGPVIQTDASKSTHFRVVLNQNAVLAAPTHLTDGQRILWEFKQDGVGGRTISLDAIFNSGPYGSLVLSTNPESTDYIAAIYNKARNELDVLSFGKGY